MKILYIALAVIALLFIASQIYFLIYDSRIETHKYRVIKDIGDVQIREYEPALFAQVTVAGNMFESQNQAFRKLAGYIFGGNEHSESISMTAPVQMQDDEQGSEMRFMVPSKYSIDELPKPNDSSIQFTEEKGYYVAAIQFGGFYNKQRYEKYKEMLQQAVHEHSLETVDDFFFQGYNAPYQLIGRKNEVLVKIKSPS
ncbi:MAG: heme-binding protein [Saprospiraceae bacterium]|nr:heme-binding protein [Saprospiraceae bacterium]